MAATAEWVQPRQFASLMPESVVANRLANDSDAQSHAEFHQELDEVTARLQAALDGLYPPLEHLARAQIRDATPLRRAAIVLAAAMGPTPDPVLRERRLLLAAALEMLVIALGIHNLLIAASAAASAGEAEVGLDRAVAGSTILAGDYCFSRAAMFAAQTESPQVVDIFARALKRVSEGQLRAIVGEVTDQNGTERELLEAGAQAGCHLAAQTPSAQQWVLDAAAWAAGSGPRPALELLNAQDFAPHQRARWLAALAWFDSPGAA